MPDSVTEALLDAKDKGMDDLNMNFLSAVGKRAKRCSDFKIG